MSLIQILSFHEGNRYFRKRIKALIEHRLSILYDGRIIWNKLIEIKDSVKQKKDNENTGPNNASLGADWLILWDWNERKEIKLLKKSQSRVLFSIRIQKAIFCVLRFSCFAHKLIWISIVNNLFIKPASNNIEIS